MKISKKILTSPIVSYFFSKLFLLYGKTFKVEVENEEIIFKYLENGGKLLFCLWHQHLFGLVYYGIKMKKYNPVCIVSSSNDGEVISGMLKKIGWNAVRGSSSKGGRKAMQNLIDNIEKIKMIAHAVDGPRGPAGEVKAGAIKIARKTGAYIVPAYLMTDSFWQFKSWDGFLLPKPFSKIKIKFDDMILCEDNNNPSSFENQRITLEQIMLPYLKKSSYTMNG